MPELEFIKETVVKQAEKKGWNNRTGWMLQKLSEELEEFYNALRNRNSTEEEIGEEFADIIIVITQICHNQIPTINLDFAVIEQLNDSELSSRQTELELFKEIIVKQVKEKNSVRATSMLLLKFDSRLTKFYTALQDPNSTEEYIGQRFAKVIITLIHICSNQIRSINLDYAVMQKIQSNWINKKKTLDDESGEIVRR